MGASKLVVSGSLDVHLSADRICWRPGGRSGGQRICDGILGHSDRAQRTLDTSILWATSSTCLNPYHGLPVVRGSRGDNSPLAIGYMGWASVHALSGVGERGGSIKPVHGAPKPGSETVGYGEFVSFGTAALKNAYDSLTGAKSIAQH
jgi:hypothetical protein